MTTIALYPNTEQYNKNIRYKLRKYKYCGQTIYSNFGLKVELGNLFKFNQFFRNQLALNGYCKIPFDYIVLPDNICQIIKSNSKTNSGTNFIPVKFIFKSKSISDKVIIMNSFILRMSKIIGFVPELEFMKLTQCVCEELGSFVQANNLAKSNSINLMDDFISDITNNFTIIYSCDYKNILLFNDYFVFVMTDDYILFYPKSECEKKNYYLIIGGKIYIKTGDITMVMKFNKEITQKNTQADIVYRIVGYIKSSTQKELLNYSINSKMEIIKNYSYVDKEKKIDMKFSSVFYCSLGLEISKYIKSGCVFEEHYNHNNNFRHIISQYGNNDGIENGNNSSGLRYRGKKYSGSSIGDKNISKTIWDGDKIVYNKEGDDTLINLLVEDPNNSLRTEMVIGWKVAKSNSGELRIVKLGILPDAIIVRPVDEEYFITGGKERCDKAIVMDIQLPIKDNEISVVPEERSVYSYIYNYNYSSFEYNVGGEVIPDSFDSNEDKGCANGIHYFRNRLDVFKNYID